MKYREGAQLDPSQMGGGGGGRGGKVAIGGGGALLVLILALVFGQNVDLNQILGSQADPQASPGSGYEQCRQGSDVAKNRECRFVAYTNSIQSYWASQLQGYKKIQVQTFTGRVSTACGTATSAVGPFYCPGDTTVYLDTGFFDELTTKFGAQGGDAAEAYVFAHEFGHHIQNLTGVMRQAQGSSGTGPKSAAVRLELQADCYAGVWLNHAADDPQSPIAEISTADVRNAADAAAAVGDDRIQQKMQGQVTPETFSHGSAAMRQKWLGQGFSTGDPNQCDTFASNAP